MGPAVEELRCCLVDVSQPMDMRTHAAFYLRTDGGSDAVQAICQALKNKRDSALLRHELAYILGQIQNPSACNVLVEVLADAQDDAMVRHEAAEALGAIGDSSCLEVLEKYASDPVLEVADTCKLSIDLIKWRKASSMPAPTGTNTSGSQEGALDRNPYLSVDPAPADRKDLSIAELRARLLDPSLPLFVRYRAMFSLRNRGSEEAVLALCEGFHDESPLFRHEIAYVLGQMQHRASVPALQRVLEDPREHRMVRHEAAEALGAVGGQDCEELLKKYVDDSEVVVRESCVVGLSTLDYWAGSLEEKL